MLYDRDNYADIAANQVTPAMMGHFSVPERTIIRLVLGLDGRTTTTDEELQEELSFVCLDLVIGCRRTAFRKLRELISAMEDARASPGQVRLSAELSKQYGVTVASAELTTELLADCFRAHPEELDILDLVYLGSTGQMTVMVSQLIKQYGQRARSLKASALKRLAEYLSGDNSNRNQEGENKHGSANDNLSGSNPAEKEIPTYLSREALEAFVIQPARRIRGLEQEVRELREELAQLRAALSAHLGSTNDPNEAP